MTDVQQARVEAAVEEARKHRHVMVAPGPHECSCGAVLDGFAEAHRRHRAKATLAAADAVMTVEQIERAIMGRTATAGANAVMALLRGEAGPVQCDQHKPVQHRDGKPPWCRACGKTATGTTPVSRFEKEAGA